MQGVSRNELQGKEEAGGGFFRMAKIQRDCGLSERIYEPDPGVIKVQEIIGRIN